MGESTVLSLGYQMGDFKSGGPTKIFLKIPTRLRWISVGPRYYVVQIFLKEKRKKKLRFRHFPLGLRDMTFAGSIDLIWPHAFPSPLDLDPFGSIKFGYGQLKFGTLGNWINGPSFDELRKERFLDYTPKWEFKMLIIAIFFFKKWHHIVLVVGR